MDRSRVTVALVHGAWGGAWSWARVSYQLKRRGIHTVAVDLPSRGPAGGLGADAKAVLDAAPGPVVLVGHSYGGMVITEVAAAHDAVAHLVYVCAPVPEPGETVNAIMATDPVPNRLAEILRWHTDGTTTVDPAGARTEFFADASDAAVRPVLPALGTHLMSTFDEPATAGPAGAPTTSVIGTQDRVLSPALQRRMARNTDHTVELDAAHCPMLTQPAALVELIAATLGSNVTSLS